MKTATRRYRHLSPTATALALLLAVPLVTFGSDPVDGVKAAAARILKTAGVHGGLIVHIGCGDGELTAALRANDAFLVQGLSSDAVAVAQTRHTLQAMGVYGPVSIDAFDGEHLPYASDLVKLAVVADSASIPRSELTRVLCPGGVAITLNPQVEIIDQWVKPWPDDIDDWTHWLHDAGNSGVAHDDRVGPPRRLQWTAGPLWSRGHEVISSLGAVVTARGRIFSVIDEGQTGVYSLPSQWKLIARDAFSGVLLWKRALPHWSAPVDLGGFTHGFRPQRLATDGERIYLPMDADAKLTIVDCLSGNIVKSFDNVRGVDTVLCDRGCVLAVTKKQTAAARRAAKAANALDAASLVAVRADTLSLLWTAPVSPPAIALASGHVFYWLNGDVVALSVDTGKEEWRSAFAVSGGGGKRRPSNPSLRADGDRVVVEAAARVAAFSSTDGKRLWETKNTPVSKGELFAAAGLLWRPQGSTLFGHDLATGEVRKSIDASAVFTKGHHPRCYPSKATDRFVITNNRGAEFVSLTSNDHVENDWLRGSCGHGIVPANGLLYVPPNPCFCYPGAKITGFNALASNAESIEDDLKGPTASRLVKGPAFGMTSSTTDSTHAADWPTYRHDPSRTGATEGKVATQLAVRWTTQCSGRITPPVVSAGRLYVALKDTHAVRALSVADGRPLWQFTAGGPIDSPPTILGSLVLFGCADGRVYCLRAEDGQLVWRFQAAPSPRRIVAFNQLESPWRVHGSVLIHDGLAFFTAGRSTYLDGGLFVYALDPATGQVVYHTQIDTYTTTRDDARGKPFVPAYHMEGAQSDILTSQGGFIYLGQLRFDSKLHRQDAPYSLRDVKQKKKAMDLSGQPYTVENDNPKNDYEDVQRKWVEKTQTQLVAGLRQQFGTFNYGTRQMGLHVFATSGFLDDTWFNRTFWMYSKTWPGFYIGHRASKAGQLLVVGPSRTYAVQAYPSRNLQSPLFTPGQKGYLLLADNNDNEPVLDDETIEVTKGWGFTRNEPPVWFDWAPIRIRGMVLAGDNLFVAGPPDVVDPDDPMAAFEGRRGAKLRVYASTSGQQQADYTLDAPPQFDGLIAAENRLFIATTNGKIVCLAKKKRP